MYTTTHPLISAHSGEPVQITFTITDNAGASVNLTGATAVYKIARHVHDAALVTKTTAGGIAISGNNVIISFNTLELIDGATPLLGDFFAQLTVAKNDESLIVAEGPLHIAPTIS